MCAGDFVEVYGSDPGILGRVRGVCCVRVHVWPISCVVGTWDSVVTCFFLDTAPVVLSYIRTIFSILKPGGYWLNVGPLLYHWQGDSGDVDERYGQSVELSYEEIRFAMCAAGFNILVRTLFSCAPRTHTHIFVDSTF
jgi:hypothetical protein